MGGIVTTLAFPVPDRNLSKQSLLSRGQEMIWLSTPKKNLRIPAVHIQRYGAKFTLIYSHGNAEDVGLSCQYLEQLSRVCKASILAYEYPGYSLSEGRPGESNCYDAIDAAFQYLKEHVAPTSIVVFGRSLGTGPTVDIASRIPDLAGVILQSPLESGIRCVMGSVPAYSLYPLDIFRSYQKVHKIKCPVFIMHGDADKVVPSSNGRALYETLCKRKCHVEYAPLWIDWAGHNNMPDQRCLMACRDFLDFLSKNPIEEILQREADNENTGSANRLQCW